MSARLKKGYLQWRCRRGTKELDVLLTNFLDSNYDSLTDAQIQDFDELLDAQDTTLWYWLIGKETPEAQNIKAIIKLISFKK
jgi:antitoxin CptB